MLCALVQNNLVTAISDLSDEQIQAVGASYEAIVDISEMNPQPTIGWILSGNILIPGEGQLGIPTWKITKLAMRQRFTFSELVTLTSFAAGVGQYNTYVAVLMDNLRVATYVDLKRQDTADGLGLLVQLGKITSDRATAILTTPPSPQEVYKE